MKNKNYYIVVNEENGSPLLLSAKLPIYWRMKVAKEVAKNYSNSRIKYVVRKLSADTIENMILKSKP